MTMTDDALVRDLIDRADRALPAMSLDADEVLTDGRRLRRRHAVLRTLGGAAAVLFAVGVVQNLPGDRAAPADWPPIVVGDVTFAAAVQAIETQTSQGSMYDLGLLRDPGDPDGGRYVLDVAPGLLGLRSFDPQTGAAGGTAGLGFTDPPVATATTGPMSATILGVVADGTTPQLVVDGTTLGAVPTITVPGVPGAVFVVSVTAPAPQTRWPTVVVRFGTDATGQPLEISLDAVAPSAVWSPTVVEEFDTEYGPALELSGPGLSGNARSLVLLPERVEFDPVPPFALATLRTSRNAAEPLATLRSPAGAAEVGDALEDGSDGAIVDGVAYLVGVLPTDAARAALTVGDVRVPLGTFSMPSLPGRWGYVAAVDLSRVAPETQIGVEYQREDGLLIGGWLLLP